jgi:hypothetical protein
MDGPLPKIIAALKSNEALKPQTHSYLRGLQAALADDVVKLIPSQIVRGEAKQVNVEIRETKWPYLEIINIADVQFGHVDCKYERLQEMLDWILKEPYRFAVLTGDMVDAAHAFTPGVTWDNLFSAQSQVCAFVEMFARVRHRILGYVGGNHERRALPMFGDLGTLIALLLKLPYSSGRQYVNIKYGEHKPFPILLWHGHPRARTKGALAQIMDRFMRIGTKARLYLTGHNHQGILIPSFREVTVNGEMSTESYYGASGTSFLQTYGSYGEWMGFESYDVLMPRARLWRDGKWWVGFENEA